MGKILNFLLKSKYKKFYASQFEQCINDSFDKEQNIKNDYHHDNFYQDSFQEKPNDNFRFKYNYPHNIEQGFCPNYGYDLAKNKIIDKQIYWPDPFQVKEDGKILFAKNTKIDWIAKIYYEQKYLDYTTEPLGSFEISLNIFDNKIALYACECKTKFLFIYASELKTRATMFNILVAFNIFFSFIKKNNLPLIDIHIDKNDTYLEFSFLNDPNFRGLFEKYLNFENLFITKSNEFISLKKHQINSLNILLIQNTWLISNYWNIFNNLNFEYKDENNVTILYTSPLNYIRKLLHNSDFIN